MSESQEERIAAEIDSKEAQKLKAADDQQFRDAVAGQASGARPFLGSGPGLGDITGITGPPSPERNAAMQNEHILQYFSYSHLPPHLQEISLPFGRMAQFIMDHCPRNPERTVALRKLLEAKDAAVRATLAQ